MKNIVKRALVAAVAAGAVATATPGANAVVIAHVCRSDSISYICLQEVEQLPVGQDVYTLVPGSTVQVAEVGAYLDLYRLGDLTFSCITPVVNGDEQDTCGTLGFTRVNRQTLVAAQPVGASVPQVATLTTIYACTARLNARVADNGVNDRMIITLCRTV